MTVADPSEEDQCLPPCHLLVQYYIRGDFLESCVYMRSVDVCLGLPSDVVLYATMQLLIAQSLEIEPGALTFFMGDTHIYENHLKKWNEQKHHTKHEPPGYELHPNATCFNFVPEYLELVHYPNELPKVSYELNV